MTEPQTEALHEMAHALDSRPLIEVAHLLAESQIAAAASVREAEAAIAAAASIMAETIQRGGRLHYAAAGSSGLMAAADAQELGGTFSIPAPQIRIHMAGGLPTGVEMPGETEDDASGLTATSLGLSRHDTLIAISASGTTPYTLAIVDIARGVGATIVAIANNPGTELLESADYPILLATPPEIISGSTRMGAGTAQKIALNMLSTIMGIQLGHVHDGMMVNLHADNAKLNTRAIGMVCRIAGVQAESAATALEMAKGSVKIAVLVSAQSVSAEKARRILEDANGNLRAALARGIDG